jgi:hypothetical protein
VRPIVRCGIAEESVSTLSRDLNRRVAVSVALTPVVARMGKIVER